MKVCAGILLLILANASFVRAQDASATAQPADPVRRDAVALPALPAPLVDSDFKEALEKKRNAEARLKALKAKRAAEVRAVTVRAGPVLPYDPIRSDGKPPLEMPPAGSKSAPKR